MKSKLLLLIIGFCAGIITTLWFLSPGKIGPTVLVNGDEQLQRQQLDQAGQKVEELGNAIISYVTRKPAEDAAAK